MPKQLTWDEFEAFVREKRAAAIHFDAAWDVGHRPSTRRKMQEAETAFGDTVNFGEIDCDRSMEIAKSIQLRGVPAVAYYIDGKLQAVLLGAQQNVRARIKRLLSGERIGYKDGQIGLGLNVLE